MNDSTLMLWALTHGWMATDGKTKSEAPGWHWWGYDDNGKAIGHRVLSDSKLPMLDRELREILLAQVPDEVRTIRQGLEAEYPKNPNAVCSKPKFNETNSRTSQQFEAEASRLREKIDQSATRFAEADARINEPNTYYEKRLAARVSKMTPWEKITFLTLGDLWRMVANRKR